MEAFLREQTECCICLRVMLGPKSLRCLHTFCAECVDKMIKGGTIECPCCKSTCESDDIKNDFKVQELIDIRIKQHQTGAGTSSEDSGLEDYPARQLKSLRQQLCAQIEATSQNTESGSGQVVEQGQGRKRRYAAAFYNLRGRKQSDEDGVIARLIKARDRVTSAEDNLRTCLSDGPHSPNAAAIASQMTKDIKKVLQEAQSLKHQHAQARRRADQPQHPPAHRRADEPQNPPERRRRRTDEPQHPAAQRRADEPQHPPARKRRRTDESQHPPAHMRADDPADVISLINSVGPNVNKITFTSTMSCIQFTSTTCIQYYRY